MNIQSVIYTDDASAVAITMADGNVWHTDAALPPDTEVRRWLAEWCNAGGVITPFVSPTVPLPLVTARQLRLQLISMGITLNSIDALINAMSEPHRSIARVEWEYATTYSRTHPLVEQLAATLSLTNEQVDAAWLAAASFE